MFYRATKVIFWSAFWSAFVMAVFFGWQKDIFGIVSFLLGAVCLVLLLYIQKSKLFSKYYSESFGHTLLGLGGLIFLLSDLGNLYFYDNLTSDWVGYDTLAHFIIPLLFMIMAAMLYEFVRLRKGVPGALEVVLVCAFAITAFSILWELFERQSDIWWGTHLFWDPTQPVAVDTADDLVADFYGVFVGGIIIFNNWTKWNNKWLKKDK